MTVAYTLLLELLLIPAILLWPDLRRAGAGIGELLPAEFLRNIFRQVMSPDDDGAFLAYMAVQLFFKGVNVVGVAGAVLMGSPMRPARADVPEEGIDAPDFTLPSSLGKPLSLGELRKSGKYTVLYFFPQVFTSSEFGVMCFIFGVGGFKSSIAAYWSGMYVCTRPDGCVSLSNLG